MKINISLAAWMVLFTWICVIIAAFSLQSSWLRRIVEATIYLSILVSFALIFTSPRNTNRNFFIGFCFVSIGMILLRRFGIWSPGDVSRSITQLFTGNWTNAKDEWFSGNISLAPLIIAHSFGLIGGLLVNILSTVSKVSADEDVVDPDD